MTHSALPETLQIRRHVHAARLRVFDAWTDPDSIVRWWGPPGVRCSHAEIDLSVGGSFTIVNEMPDGSNVHITGIYETIDRPQRLVHSWTVDSATATPGERVEIDFTERDGGTDITITHTGIPTPDLRAGHQAGWIGCLDGFTNLIEQPAAPT